MSRTLKARPRYFPEGGKWNVNTIGWDTVEDDTDDSTNDHDSPKVKPRYFREAGDWDIDHEIEKDNFPDGDKASKDNLPSEKFEWEKKPGLK